MSPRALARHAASAARRAVALALAAVQAGLGVACIGTVPPVAEPPAAVRAVAESEALRALEPDHWGDE